MIVCFSTIISSLVNSNSEQACKQVEAKSAATEEDPRLMVAKRSVAVNQHHDAVTGNNDGCQEECGCQPTS